MTAVITASDGMPSIPTTRRAVRPRAPQAFFGSPRTGEPSSSSPRSSTGSRLFAFGPLVATPGALRALVREGADPARLLARHGAGDWGALSADDHDANDEAVRSGERILSAYDFGSTRLWIITDAATDGPVGSSGVRPRHATTLLLPTSEY